MNPWPGNYDGVVQLPRLGRSGATAAAAGSVITDILTPAVTPPTIVLVPAEATGWDAFDGVNTTQFVQVGGTIFTFGHSFPYSSTDGVAWTKLSTAITGSGGLGIAYGNGVFVAIGGISAKRTFTSADGSTWVLSHNFAAAVSDLRGIAFGAGLFIIVGFSVKAFSSPDGVTWSNVSIPGTFDRIEYLNGQFIAIGQGGALATSPDGLTWTSQTSNTSNRLRSICYGNSLYVACGDNSTVITSPDGIVWTVQTTPGLSNCEAVGYGSGTYLLINNNGDAYTSTDAITWTFLRTESTGGFGQAVGYLSTPNVLIGGFFS